MIDPRVFPRCDFKMLYPYPSSMIKLITELADVRIWTHAEEPKILGEKIRVRKDRGQRILSKLQGRLYLGNRIV